MILFFVYLFYKVSRVKTPTVIHVSAAAAAAPPSTAAAGGPLYFDNGVEPQNPLNGMPGILQTAASPPARAVVPINIETRPSSGVDFVQVGILSRGQGEVLPLMGRKLSREKWNYYAVSNSNMYLKLPVMVNGRDCMVEYGCDPIYSGDMVYVEGYGDGYKATVYQNSLMRYLPI
jgi:hypothetical protein